MLLRFVSYSMIFDMAQIHTTQSDDLQTSKRFHVSIGLRLSLAFILVILLTGLIGLLAIQQFSSLTNTTTELNSHDLPEAITLVHLRSLLYRQRDLEFNLINTGNPHGSQSSYHSQPEDLLTVAAGTPQSKQAQQTLSELASMLKEIAADRQQLLAFESSSQRNARDLPQVQSIANGVLKTSALSQAIQSLVTKGQLAQARTLYAGKMEPLRVSTIAAVTQLITIEQKEASTVAAQAQQESGRSTLFVFTLTALCLLLSMALAVIITRSLTRPLKVLLHSTEDIAAGNLDVEPEVKRGDEIGRLATAYDKMRLSLRSTIASLRLERQQTQAIIDATADGIMVVDEVQKIVKCNPATEHISGWQTEDAIGRYCWEVLGFKAADVEHEENHEPLHSLLTALQSRTEQSYIEMPITSRSGQERWVALSCAPVPPATKDAGQHMVIGLHDISQLKAVEQMKSDFVAMVSHELRAPLTTVTGSVEILSLLEPTSDPELYQEVLSMLDQQTQRLHQVVEEVLQLTRFEAGRLDIRLQPVSLVPFLQSLVEKMQAEWISGDHTCFLHTPDEEILVWADAGLLEIVLRNLFDNARKYTPPSTVVEVETEIISSTGQVEIRVIDDGPGIPADQLEHIFERFSRGPQSSENWTRGYGLGLHIAQKLMLAHNGSIRAEKRDCGACFVLSLWMVGDGQANGTVEDVWSALEEREVIHEFNDSDD